MGESGFRYDVNDNLNGSNNTINDRRSKLKTWKLLQKSGHENCSGLDIQREHLAIR